MDLLATFQVYRLHSMAVDALADHVRHQHRRPDRRLGRPLHLPDAAHRSRKTRVSAEQMSRSRSTDFGVHLYLLLGGNANFYEIMFFY